MAYVAFLSQTDPAMCLPERLSEVHRQQENVLPSLATLASMYPILVVTFSAADTASAREFLDLPLPVQILCAGDDVGLAR